MNKKIAIIGGGNLGTAIAEGLINSGFTLPEHILITKRNIKTLASLEKRGVLVSDNNEEAVGFADMIILAVKPFQVDDILGKLKALLNPEDRNAPPALHPLQQAWIDEQVPQCGYCQNGMMIRATELLNRVKRPTEAQIKSHMNTHLCRCGTYPRITKAIKRAATTMAKGA